MHVDNLVLNVEDERTVYKKFKIWNEGMGSKDLRVNLSKVKVRVSQTVGDDNVVVECVSPRAVCHEAVGTNPIVFFGYDI